MYRRFVNFLPAINAGLFSFLLVFSLYALLHQNFYLTHFIARDLIRAQTMEGGFFEGPETLAGWRLLLPNLYYFLISFCKNFSSLIWLQVGFFSLCFSTYAANLYRRFGSLHYFSLLIALLGSYSFPYHFLNVWNPSFFAGCIFLILLCIERLIVAKTLKNLILFFLVIIISAGFHIQSFLFFLFLPWLYLSERNKKVFLFLLFVAAIFLPLVASPFLPIFQIQRVWKEHFIALGDIWALFALLILVWKRKNITSSYLLPLIVISALPAAFFWYSGYHYRYTLMWLIISIVVVANVFPALFANYSKRIRYLIYFPLIVSSVLVFLHKIEERKYSPHLLSEAFTRISNENLNWSSRTYIVGDRMRLSWPAYEFYSQNISNINVNPNNNESFMVWRAEKGLEVPLKEIEPWLVKQIQERTVVVRHILTWNGWNIAGVRYANLNWPIQMSNIFQNFWQPFGPIDGNYRCIPDPFDGSCLANVGLQVNAKHLSLKLSSTALSSINRHYSPVTAEVKGLKLKIDCGKLWEFSLPNTVGSNSTNYESGLSKLPHQRLLSPLVLSFSNQCGKAKMQSVSLNWDQLERSSPGLKKQFRRVYNQSLMLYP